MSDGAKLRAVGEHETAPAGEPVAPRVPEAPGFNPVLWLSVALSITLLLLVWSRFEQGAQIHVLQDEARELRSAVESRDQVIDAHERRLTRVRDHVEGLRILLEEPLPKAE
jgi:hypothetical protein